MKNLPIIKLSVILSLTLFLFILINGCENKTEKVLDTEGKEAQTTVDEAEKVVTETENEANPAPTSDSTIPQPQKDLGETSAQKEQVVANSLRGAVQVALSQFSCERG